MTQIFSAFLGLAGSRLAEVSLSRAAAWAALSGVLVGAVPFALGTPSPDNASWLGLAVIGSFTLMSVVSAVGSVLLIRMAKHRQLRGARGELQAG